MLTDQEIEALELAVASSSRDVGRVLWAIIDREKKRKELNILRDRMERAEAIG